LGGLGHEVLDGALDVGGDFGREVSLLSRLLGRRIIGGRFAGGVLIAAAVAVTGSRSWILIRLGI
jgi:hypothetical protein